MDYREDSLTIGATRTWAPDAKCSKTYIPRGWSSRRRPSGRWTLWCSWSWSRSHSRWRSPGFRILTEYKGALGLNWQGRDIFPESFGAMKAILGLSSAMALKGAAKSTVPQVICSAVYLGGGPRGGGPPAGGPCGAAGPGAPLVYNMCF